MIHNGKQRFVVLLSLMLLSACGIDRGGIVETIPPSVSSIPEPGGAIGGTISNIDTAASSININGKTLDVTATTIFVNGEVSSLSALSDGQFATTFSQTGTSVLSPQELRVDFNAAGGVVAFDPTSPMFDQFGLEVELISLVTNLTGPALPNPGLQSLAVSGFVTSNGTVDASSVTTYDSSNPFVVTGFATQIDPTNFIFEFGMQAFDYSQSISINTPNGMITEFERIRVQLAPGITNSAFNVLTIDSAPLIDSRLTADASINLAGYITAPIANQEFGLSYASMVTDANTIFANTTAAGLTLDRLVAIEGVLQTDGRVLVETITVVE